MPLILPGNVASATAGAYEVANSCRFNDDDSPSMKKTLASPTSAKKFTYSGWLKRGYLGSGSQSFFSTGLSGDSHYFDYRFETNGIIRLNVDSANEDTIQTNAMFCDPSAWYHICGVVDTTDSTEADRIRLYVNGVRITSFNEAGYPSLNDDIPTMVANDEVQIGLRLRSGTQQFDGYMAEVCFIDGLALEPTSFGEFDEDSPTIWKPKDVSGLTFGNNGFYLDFEDSSNLGNDANGGTDLTESNLDATDQATDTPTNNFCTLNPLSLHHSNTPTLAQGNCRYIGVAAHEFGCIGTMGISSGKWYFERKMVSQDAGPDDDSFRNVFGVTAQSGHSDFQMNNSYTWTLNGTPAIQGGGSVISSVGSALLSDGGIFQCALDLDNNRIAFGHDDAWQSGSGSWSGSYSDYESIDDPASTPAGFYFPVIGDASGSRAYTADVNFGGCPAFAISSAQSDENGYGTFEFAPPSGFLALCSKNLGSDGG